MDKQAVIVHRIGIARSAAAGGSSVINTASCRLCKLVIERGGGRLLIKVPGLYAVRDAGTERMDAWGVEEPLPAGMEMCTLETLSL